MTRPATFSLALGRPGLWSEAQRVWRKPSTKEHRTLMVRETEAGPAPTPCSEPWDPQRFLRLPIRSLHDGVGGGVGQAVATVSSAHHQPWSLLLPGITLPRAHQPPGPILPSRGRLTPEDALGSWG